MVFDGLSNQLLVEDRVVGDCVASHNVGGGDDQEQQSEPKLGGHIDNVLELILAVSDFTDLTIQICAVNLVETNHVVRLHI